jgi:hypothetical protein
LATHSAIARSIENNLLQPESAICRGDSSAASASVPKAPVEEKGHPTPTEQKVR